MAEFLTAFKTETQIILARHDRKFRRSARSRIFIAHNLAQHTAGQIPAAGPLRSAVKADIVRLAFRTEHDWARHDICFGQLGGGAPESDGGAGHPRCRLCDGLWQWRTRQGRLCQVQRDFRTRGRGVFRRHRHGREFTRVDAGQQAGRRRLLSPRGARDRGRMRRAGIFHRRHAALSGRRRSGAHGPGQARARDRPLSSGSPAFGPAGRRFDHPVDRDRHGLQPRPDRRYFGDRAQGGIAAAHGRRALRQRAGLARHDAGGNDLEARRRHAVLRRHQERLLVRRGDRAVRPQQGCGNGLHPQARRAALFQGRASSRRSSTPISTTGCGWRPRAMPIRWLPGWPATSARQRKSALPGSPPPTRSSPS